MAMKTTLDISDPLLREARKIATRDRTTLRELVEQGLRKIIAERKAGHPFRLRKVTFKGEGLVPELRDADWDRIRDLAYEGRGG
jgi:Bacterial antitoxin of type II TA system, VapB